MRLKTPVVQIGSIKIGGNNPIAVQSMTDTDTADVSSTVKQCIELIEAGSEMVRVTVDNEESARAIPNIRKILNQKGFNNIPLIGDFHFNGHILLTNNPKCAKSLDKYRINPGNIGTSKTYDQNFCTLIEIARKYNKPIRIGANSGSIPTVNRIVKAVLDSAIHAEKLGLKKNQIILSVKMTEVEKMIKAYRKLESEMKKKKHIYPLHLGLTEAGSGINAIINSTSALAVLLEQGIGDTIRVSLTPVKNHPRTEEVRVSRQILQSLNLRSFTPHIISCPGCGRTNSKYFQNMVGKITSQIEANFPKWQQKNPNTKNLKIAVMGCIVNGPGESRSADIAIHLPGKNEKKSASLYIRGKYIKQIFDPGLADKFIKIIEEQVKTTFANSQINQSL